MTEQPFYSDADRQRFADAAARNSATARAARQAREQAAADAFARTYHDKAAATPRSEATRMDPAPHLRVDPDMSPAASAPRDPNAAAKAAARAAVLAALARSAAVRAGRTTATARLVAAMEAALGDDKKRAHLEAPAQPVEIRRPAFTPVEAAGITLSGAVGTLVGIAFVRAAARRVFGVHLTRRDAWLLILAGGAVTRGSGWQTWTRGTLPTRRGTR